MEKQPEPAGTAVSSVEEEDKADEATGAAGLGEALEVAHPPRGIGRARLVWYLLVFQFKLGLDGLRDLLLSPIVLVAGVLGVLEGGSDPGRYLRRVIAFGRTTEHWINLFYHPRTGTADDLFEPLGDRFESEVERSLIAPKRSSSGTRAPTPESAAVDRTPANSAGRDRPAPSGSPGDAPP
ncbi:MAG: hypothetical protein AAF648_08205 [Pseudomonadota bacterium]